MTATSQGTTSYRSYQPVDELIRRLETVADDLDALAGELDHGAPAAVPERLTAHAETARQTATSIEIMVHGHLSAPSTDYFLG